MLAEFLGLGRDAVGSRALAGPMQDLFLMSLETWTDRIGDVLNRFAIPRLWALNGWPDTTMPTLTHGPLKDIDLASLGQALLQTSQAGIPWVGTPDEVSVTNRVREVCGFDPLPAGANLTGMVE
jgi:hypothetical protein